jgi:hypothetical protein
MSAGTQATWPEWREIATAPKDGTEVLVRVIRANCPGSLVAHYTHGGGEEQPPFGPAWFFYDGSGFRELAHAPTKWLPLPPPPVSP